MADDDNDPNDQMLEDSESLDSDELGEGVGDGVADAPDDWAGADRIGTTAREERDGETLDERLAEEIPDIGATERPDRPLANTYTEDVDEVTNNVVVLGERGDGEDIAYD